jgi:sigma-B regulation protein RsbU (phosphoserine phosphatase)
MSDNLKGILDKKIGEYKIKVLLVDDQLIVGETVKRMLLENNEIEFYFCQQPTEAIKMAQEIEPTIILQDLIMPDIDGLTLVKFYRSHPKLKNIPIIILSSKEEATTKAEMFEKGANDYLVKLPDKIELIARIKYHSAAYINLLQRNEAYLSLEKSQKALANELNKAAEYVKTLLPEKISNDLLETYWEFIPSAQLGGDAFGYHWIDNDNFCFYLLDVCGHGVGSALLSVSAISNLRSQTLVADFTKPVEVITMLNKAYQMSEHNDLYFTIWYGVINFTTRELKYISAGHPPAFVIYNNEINELMNENFIIGGLPDFPFKESKIILPNNTDIFVFSDGAYEIEKKDGTFWTLNEAKQYILSNNTSNGEILNKLYEYVKTISEKVILDDDFSIMKIKLK